MVFFFFGMSEGQEILFTDWPSRGRTGISLGKDGQQVWDKKGELLRAPLVHFLNHGTVQSEFQLMIPTKDASIGYD
jgi:hypothetical protein